MHSEHNFKLGASIYSHNFTKDIKMFGLDLQIFGLNDYVGPGATQNIVTAIQRIRYTQGRTNTDRALRFMREEIFARVSTHCLRQPYQGQSIFHFHARF